MAKDLELEIQEDEDTQRGKYMTFKSGNEFYGIGINYVNEIIGLQKLTEIPESEDYIKGLINLRGKIIPAIDVRARFRKPPIEYNDRTCIIVVEIKSIIVGLIVDTIAEVITIDEKNVVPPPSIGASSNKYVYGIGKVGDEVKLLLDCEKLISESDLQTLKEMAAS